jgi:hypothetical protein
VDGEAGLHVAVARHREARACGAGWAVRAGVAVGLAACGEGAMTIAPVIDVPIEDPEATASGLDQIKLTIAHARSDQDLVSHVFPRGTALELSSVPFGDDLVLHMSGLIGASPIAYGRTCAVRVSPVAAAPAPHLFFSRGVKFASLAVTPEPRVGGLGIAYQGTALLVGGVDMLGQSLVTDVERFDPATGQLSKYGTVLARDRAVYALLGIAPPRAIVIGGIAGGEGAGFVEVLDGQAIERTDVAETARIDLTATALTDGRVMVIGGNPPGLSPVGEIDEIAQGDSDTVEVRRLNATLARPRRSHTATRLGDDVGAPVLITGGADDTGMPIDIAELFKPLSEDLANPMTFAFKLNIPRYGHTATLMPDGSVLIIGGFDALGQPVRKLELFSVDAGFNLSVDLPLEAGLVEFAATTLPDGRILLTGGRVAPGMPPVDTAYIVRLDPLSGRVDVVATDHMAVARAGHQAVVLCDGTIFISGGTEDQPVAERYNPPPTGRR